MSSFRLAPRIAARRWPQFVLIGSSIVGSWLGMQAIHESGHVLGALLTGGRVNRVVLNPLSFSRTDLSDNPSPLFVAWSGPVFGVVAPLFLWIAVAAVQPRSAHFPRFFAGFCLLANGLYIGVGSFGRVGDCDEMLRHGSTPWHLWLFGLLTAPVGLGLWNGLGRYFGLGITEGQVSRAAALGSLAVCLLLVVLGIVVGGE